MYKKGIVKGIDITTLTHQPSLCKNCIMGKQTCRHFDGSTHLATELLEHVHIDLWGPSCVISTAGKQYMMEAVDAFGSHTEGYFLADKEAGTTLTGLEHYVALAEQQTGKKVKCLYVDGGSEFCNKLWECKERGIVLEPNTAYSLESNGIVERSHFTVIEHTCVLMVENDFPPSMWCEIAATVLYFKDFIPTACHPDTTPYESWHQMKPDISHLCPIRCTSYAKIPVEKGGSKLDPCSIKGF